jgi:arylsulfatase B
LWDTDRPARELAGTDYEEFIFQRRMLDIIDGHHHSHSKRHNQTQQQQQPLLLFYAPHVAHCPLQVPQSYLDQFDNMEDDQGYCAAQTPNILPVNQTQPAKPQCRKQYHAMVKLLDDIIASLVDRLKKRRIPSWY